MFFAMTLTLQSHDFNPIAAGGFVGHGPTNKKAPSPLRGPGAGSSDNVSVMVKQPVLPGPDYGLGSAVHLQFVVNVRNVVFYCALRDRQHV